MTPDMISARVHAAIADGRITRNALVCYPSSPSSDIRPTVRPFEGEIHSTIDINGIILIAPSGFTLSPELAASRTGFPTREAFESYLDALAAAVPHVTTADQPEVMVIEF